MNASRGDEMATVLQSGHGARCVGARLTAVSGSGRPAAGMLPNRAQLLPLPAESIRCPLLWFCALPCCRRSSTSLVGGGQRQPTRTLAVSCTPNKPLPAAQPCLHIHSHYSIHAHKTTACSGPAEKVVVETPAEVPTPAPAAPGAFGQQAAGQSRSGSPARGSLRCA